MPSGWKKNALLVGNPLDMSHSEYDKKRRDLRRWKCHTDWRTSEEAMKRLEKSSFDDKFLDDFQCNVPCSKGRIPPSKVSWHDDRRYTKSETHDDYRYTKRDTPAADDDFPELKKELEMAALYIPKYVSKGKKDNQKHDSATVKYGWSGWINQSSGTLSQRIRRKHHIKQDQNRSKHQLKTYIREEKIDGK